ncbi:MAG: NAD-dependent epimerase/dehydratase family protein [Bacteroidetes bacterium]|nr:NAD-dependent epimerase/dehydratase family protein [Bacteroidota bacterium]
MILVTGGTGLLGSHLLFELARMGRKVRAIRRESSDTSMVRKVFSYYCENPDELLENIEWFDADLMDFGAVEDSLEGIREVYHVGAVVSFYPADHKAMLKVNIEGTANLVNLSMEKGVEKFCYVSSVATLGRGENGSPTNEEDFWVTTRRNTIYGISKYGAEREVWRGMEEGLNAVIVNPSFILGPGFWNDNSGLFRLVWEGLKYYTGAVNGYVDARDIVKAMILLMDRNIFNDRFILSAENITYEKLFGAMAKYLGKPAPSVKIPYIVPSLIWRLDAARTFITRSTPFLTKEMAHTMRQNYSYTNEKIRKTLDFEFTPLEQSIREICEIYLKEKSEKRKAKSEIQK